MVTVALFVPLVRVLAIQIFTQTVTHFRKRLITEGRFLQRFVTTVEDLR